MNLICEYEAPRRILFTRGPKAKNASVKTTSLTLYSVNEEEILPCPLVKVADLDKYSDSRGLLKYFITTICPVVSVQTDQCNFFNTCFVPMTVDSDAVLYSLTYWAASHISIMFQRENNTISKTYETIALEQKGKAIKHLFTELENNHTAPEILLAASIILAEVDICAGGTSDWYFHMVGSKRIILNMHNEKSLDTSSDRSWLVRNFVYHDVLGATTLNQKPLLKASKWSGSSSVTSVLDPLMGLNGNLFSLLSEVLDTEHDEKISLEDMERKLLDLENKIIGWKPSSVPRCKASLIAFSESYRIGALVYLYRVMNRKTRIRKDMNEPVKQLLKHIEGIPALAGPESGLSWPLFIAGGEVRNVEQANLIRDRLKLIAELSGLLQAARALEVLEECWKYNLNVNNKTIPTQMSCNETEWLDWRSVLSNKSWKMVLT